ncbi:kinase-like domain-containing protein [Tribonema minus]|uniref:Cyclin-dependent kinase 2 homolog n=1 Tax=Tribonema minus TaxID=303371 RepID=A0A835YIU7_9STRA|nr:kinase-like domain-containing protein [Tribonema minus]
MEQRRGVKRRRCARDVSEYALLGPVGEGAYGVVWKANDPLTGDMVALKMIKTGAESGAPDAELGFPITSVREIRILKLLRHDNIINLKDVVTDMEGKMKGGKAGDVYMVFEYMDADLEGIMKTPDVQLNRNYIKSFMHQLLCGLDFMHRHKVIHRDLKGANLLINANGCLKIGDFGLARSMHEHMKQLTSKVITLWYRPPELLMRATLYGTDVDMWSVGCIFGEMLQRVAILPGKDEQEQMELIFGLCGTPTPESWPGVAKLPDWESCWKPKVVQRPRERTLQHRFRHLDRNVVDLLDRLLQLDPAKRITATQALDHNYFFDHPAVVAPGGLPPLSFTSCHEFEAKQRQAKERADRHRQDEERRAQQAEQKRLAAAQSRGPYRAPGGGRGGGRGGRGGNWGRGGRQPAVSKESTGW